MKKKTNGLRNSEPKKLTSAAASLAILVTLLCAVPASAGDVIPVGADGVLIAPPGSLTAVASVTVAPEKVGQLCTLTVVSHNQVSVHDGNDLIISSGSGQWVIEDVEAEANADLDLAVDVELGQIILFELRMGPDSVSSLGLDLELDCGPLPTVAPLQQTPTTLSTPATSSTTTTKIQPEPATPLASAPPAIAPLTTPGPAASLAPSTATPAGAPAEPEVLGIQVERLQETPPAPAIVAAPAYTG